jgi:hypothetical protein
MGRTPPGILDNELNEVMQAILTYVSWGLVLVMLVIAWRLGKKERTPFYLFACLAAAVAAFAEPLYDVAFDLWFYDVNSNGASGAMWSHFTAYDIVQPNWSHSGYMILYANAALFIGHKIARGNWGRRELFMVFGAEFLISCTFEMIAINGNAYEYWGPHQFRVFQYPLVIGVLEAAQVTTFTVVACLLWNRVRSWVGLLGLFALFPITFFGVNFGVGSPVIIAMHLNDPASTGFIVTCATLISIGWAVALVYGLSLFMPKELESSLPTQRRDVDLQQAEHERLREGVAAPAS